MSHHFDSPTAIEDGRLNLCDVYAFPSQPGSTSLILTVNPDAGRSSSTTFRSEAVYEFVIGLDGTTDEILSLRIRFSEPSDAIQKLHVLTATGAVTVGPRKETEVGRGTTDEVLRLDFGRHAGRLWAGTAADPFWADGVALAQFFAAAAEGRYEPELFDRHANVFDGRNVSAIVLEVPDEVLGSGRLSLWARISLEGHAGVRQVSRMGQPMLRPLFFRMPGDETEQLNAGNPVSDVTRYQSTVLRTAQTVAELAGVPDSHRHAATIAAAFLPDVLRYTPGVPARFAPGSANGRALDDDAFGTAVSLLVGHRRGRSPAPFTASSTFPYVPPAHAGELPALLELFGIRPAGADPTAASAPLVQ
jgi:Domain of unknown function (DUF4331)